MVVDELLDALRGQFFPRDNTLAAKVRLALQVLELGLELVHLLLQGHLLVQGPLQHLLVRLCLGRRLHLLILGLRRMHLLYESCQPFGQSRILLSQVPHLHVPPAQLTFNCFGPRHHLLIALFLALISLAQGLVSLFDLE